METISTKDRMATLSGQIYRILFNKIVVGELRPGDRLEEKALATQFGVSRTPIHEALKELTARGLAEFVPRRGAEVTNMGLERLVDMLEGECELEGLCAKIASQRMTMLEKGHLQNVHDLAGEIVKEGPIERYFELNAEFHNLICAGAHITTLSNIVLDLRNRLSPYRRPLETDECEKMSRSHTEHTDILRAILAGNAEQAYQAMRNHNARINSGAISSLRIQQNEAMLKPMVCS